MKFKIGDKVRIKEESILCLDFDIKDEILRLIDDGYTFKISEIVDIDGIEFYRVNPLYIIWSYKEFEKIEETPSFEMVEEIDRFELIDFED